ncbi:glycosyltransferase family 2 protein [Niallia sp. Krafla_26]|uniref:glycosyltransferase family 2 protein n=1 Tax=Niallia sp. Krafla_26 TaxID=3064703 RepID=UPI003D1829D9
MGKVDILLPIYNSYDETKNCIESVLKYTKEGTFNLYLLDDKSPDDRIPKMTKEYSEKYSFVTVVRNEQNLGFPGNVNNGFAISKRDVVVLNSDTLVSPLWLEILNKTAYSSESIAALTPMSNYGIISGVPTPNSQINALFTYEEILAAFNKSKRSGYVETPLIIGFCMYIKRSALEQVGIFDAKTFKRGYGEESDWCMRAAQKGLKLVVAQEAYVHHIGGVSFGSEKGELQRQSKRILLERYPWIDEELESYVEENHFKGIRRAIMKDLGFLKKSAPLSLKIKMIKHYMINKF